MNRRAQGRTRTPQRPQQVRRQPRRRSRRRIPLGLVLIGVAVLAVVVTLVLVNWVFTVRRVTVEGSGDISAQDVARLSGIRLGTRMRAVDAERVRGNVENDGRLAFVSLERKYPGELVLTVRQRSLDALAMQAGEVLALDSDGYVIASLSQLPQQKLPYVSGLKPGKVVVGRRMDTTDGRIPAMTAVLEALKARGFTASVAELNLENLNDIRIITRKGTTVLLGTADNMADKIAWMAGAVADIEARGETGGELDVSSGTKADYKPGYVAATATPEPGISEGEAAAEGDAAS